MNVGYWVASAISTYHDHTHYFREMGVCDPPNPWGPALPIPRLFEIFEANTQEQLIQNSAVIPDLAENLFLKAKDQDELVQE